jgi:hypothetical protein
MVEVMRAVSWLAAVVFAAAAVRAQVPGATTTSNDYCGRVSMRGKACAAVATPAGLDVSTLLGSYYEIGSTARYKLRNELGITCTHTNFTVDGSSSSSPPA